jgi:hypothetical protein
MLESKSPAASACPRSEAYRYRTEGSNQTRLDRDALVGAVFEKTWSSPSMLAPKDAGTGGAFDH